MFDVLFNDTPFPFDCAAAQWDLPVRRGDLAGTVMQACRGQLVLLVPLGSVAKGARRETAAHEAFRGLQ